TRAKSVLPLPVTASNTSEAVMVWLNVSFAGLSANLVDTLGVMRSQIGVAYAGFWSEDRNEFESIEVRL
ncbi:MAG TPA: hypothetical protein DCK99_18225, partial [Blastocatellia bacterium]|nr:hypothetical protein [Blastocatellia bacterium]